MRILVALCLSLFVLGVTAPRASAGNEHGCATANAANPSPTAQPGITPPTEAGALVINEILFNPATQWNCSDAASSPNRWIEIYNPGASSFILTTSSGDTSVFTTIDSGPDTQSYYIPDGITIAAHGFLIVFPDHPTFFYAEMPMLRLLVNGVVVNEVTPLPQFGPDTSFARKPDGGDSWESTAVATINSTNVPHLTPTLTPTPLPTRTPGITPTPQITPKVTPTPKPTITPTPTLVATPTSIVTPASTSPPGTNTTPAISTTSQSQIIDNQPTWEELHMPDLTPTGKSSPQTTTPSINSPSPTALSPPSETGLMELIRKIAMSIVATALASVLFWCWKLFDTG